MLSSSSGPAAGIGAAMLSRLDMSDGENVKDADFELQRAVDDYQLARWARRWGEQMVARLRDSEAFDSDAWVDADEHKEVEDELEGAEGEIGTLHAAMRRAINDTRHALKGSAGPKAEAILLIVSELENTLVQFSTTGAK